MSLHMAPALAAGGTQQSYREPKVSGDVGELRGEGHRHPLKQPSQVRFVEATTAGWLECKMEAACIHVLGGSCMAAAQSLSELAPHGRRREAAAI